MLEQFIFEHPVLTSIILALALVVDIAYTALSKGADHAAISFLAAVTSACFLVGTVYGFIPGQLFIWVISLCSIVYLFNRLRPSHRI